MIIPTARKVKYEIPKNPNKDWCPFLIAGSTLTKIRGKTDKKE
jgi:hypothetical protein